MRTYRIEVNATEHENGEFTVDIFMDGDYLCGYEDVSAKDIGKFVTEELEDRQKVYADNESNT